MQIGLFRRQVMKTLAIKSAKTALRTVSKNTTRVQAAQAAVALKVHTGQLLQNTSQYLLGLQQTQEMKDQSFLIMGDIGYDLAVLARALKAPMPSSTKKVKLSGTRGAAILQLDSLATDLLRQAEQGLFSLPKMTTIKKMITLPGVTDGTKVERDSEIVDVVSEKAAEEERQVAMKSFLVSAVDVYWRLSLDMFGKPPATVLEGKFKRMQEDHPGVTWVEAKKTAA